MGHGELFIVGWPLPDVACPLFHRYSVKYDGKGHFELITVNCFSC